jgi:hypothetical protein
MVIWGGETILETPRLTLARSVGTTWLTMPL